MPEPTPEETWRALLYGELRGLNRMRALFSRIPSSPRCKLCNAPFGAPGNHVLRLTGFGPSPINRRLCKVCIRSVHKDPGGAEVEVSVLIADVRGSTRLAETLPSAEYSRLIARYYGTVARAVDDHDGLVDKFVGDGAVALFIPGFAGAQHAAAAIAAAHDLLHATRDGDGRPWIPVGIGVDTGRSFVGTVGEGDALDFTALGDPVNVAARLSGVAQAGELLVTEGAANAGGLTTDGLDRRVLELRGHEQPVAAWVVAA